MSSKSATGFKILVALAFLAAALGGIWFGLFYCGGYLWHYQFLQAVLVALVLALLFYPSKQAASLGRRVLLSLAIIGVFFLVRALVAPFYPAFPGFADYFRQVGFALLSGPC